VLLSFGSEEKFEFGISAFDPPTRQHLGYHSDADDMPISEVARSVPIDAARKQKFQKQSVVIKATWSNYKSAMDKAAVAPEVVVAISCSASHGAQAKNKHRDDDCRRGYAPSGTHPSYSDVDNY
jgi:hypothetical protein